MPDKDPNSSPETVPARPPAMRRPNAARMKCAKIAGDTSGDYHPHGQETIYPTLVRMAQSWAMRAMLVDKQGNFGSLAGLPPAAERRCCRPSASASLGGAHAETSKEVAGRT